MKTSVPLTPLMGLGGDRVVGIVERAGGLALRGAGEVREQERAEIEARARRRAELIPLSIMSDGAT